MTLAKNFEMSDWRAKVFPKTVTDLFWQLEIALMNLKKRLLEHL